MNVLPVPVRPNTADERSAKRARSTHTGTPSMSSGLPISKKRVGSFASAPKMRATSVSEAR